MKTAVIACLLALVPAVASAEPLRCPGTQGKCTLRFIAPLSPAVTHICTEAVISDFCVEVEPGAQGTIERTIVPGEGDQLVSLFACRDDLNICSEASVDQAEMLDLGRPELTEVVRALVDGLRNLADELNDIR